MRWRGTTHPEEEAKSGTEDDGLQAQEGKAEEKQIAEEEVIEEVKKQDNKSREK